MESTNGVNERTVNYQFKILYALGIIFIVAGHSNNNGGIALFNNWFIPYAFHVGLFAFTSGYFYKREHQTSVLKYIKKKVLHLLVPLYIWNVFYGVLVHFLRYDGFTMGEDFTLRNLLITPITTGHQFTYNLAGWFVISLFMLEVGNIIVRKILEILKIENEYLVFVLYVGAGMCGAWLSMNGYNTGWMLVFVRVLYLIPFYGLGMLYKTKLEKLDKIPSSIYFAVIFMLQLAVITKYSSLVTYSAAWCNDFDNIYNPFLVGFLGIAFWLRISRIITPVVKESKLLNLIAENTFSIMIHQFLGFMLVKSVFAFGNQYFNLFSTFDWIEYKTNIFYFYLPQGLEQYTILYLIGGLLVPIGIAYLVGLVKKQWNKQFQKQFKKAMKKENERNRSSMMRNK